MPLKYSTIEIFTSEEASFKETLLYQAVVNYIRELKIAARCIVTRCIGGCYEDGEIASQSILIASFNMPIIIKIILPSAEVDLIVSRLENMVSEGIVTVQKTYIQSYKTRNRLIPRHLKVKDMMTGNPGYASLNTPLDKVAHLLLSSTYTGVPVIDKNQYPAGVISQGDLIYKGGMPARLGLLAESGSSNLKAVLKSLSTKKARDIMSPAICIRENKLLTQAVDLMLEKGLKRLPVINEDRKLVGILSRMDIFSTITHHTPDWNTFRQQNIPVGNLKLVSDIMHRDVHTVFPDTPVSQVLDIIGSNDIQRLAVVDKDNVFLGNISDRNMLMAFSNQKEGIWDFFVSKLSIKNEKASFDLCSKTAGEVMKTDPITILETDTIDNAIRLITEKMIKRLPVIDSHGKFKGLISRESLLRTGYLNSQQSKKSSER